MVMRISEPSFCLSLRDMSCDGIMLDQYAENQEDMEDEIQIEESNEERQLDLDTQDSSSTEKSLERVNFKKHLFTKIH